MFIKVTIISTKPVLITSVLKIHYSDVFLFFHSFNKSSFQTSLDLRNTCCTKQHILIPILLNFKKSGSLQLTVQLYQSINTNYLQLSIGYSAEINSTQKWRSILILCCYMRKRSRINAERTGMIKSIQAFYLADNEVSRLVKSRTGDTFKNPKSMLIWKIFLFLSLSWFNVYPKIFCNF